MAVAIPEVTVEGQAPPPAAPPPVTGYRPSPGLITVTNPDGSIDNVRESDLAQAQAEGSHVTTQQELYLEQAGTPGKLIAAADAFTRGATFGLSDKIQVEAGRAIGGDTGAENIRAQTRMLKEGNEGLALGGEIAGSLAGLALMPGGAAKAVTEEGLLARAGARFLEGAPRLAGEGAALSVGHQYSEDTLGNHDLVAQKYVTVAGQGALLNAILGGALHAGGGAVADRILTRAVAEEGAAVGSKTLGDRIANYAEEQAFKGTGAKLKDWQKLGATAEAQEARAQRIGRTLRKGLEKAEVRPSAETLIRRITSEVVEPLMNKPFSQAEQAGVRPYVAEIVERTAGKSTFESFDDLFRLRRALDEKIKSKAFDVVPGTQSPATKEMMKIRGILEDVYEEAAERASKELGEDIATKYGAAKARFADLKTAEKIAVKEVARQGANRAISLTDSIAAAAAIPAALAGHPMALLAPVANKLARTYGNQFAAATLDRISKLQILQRAQEKFDTKLASSVDSFFTKKAANDNAPRAAAKMDAATMRALRAAVKDPDALSERATAAVARTGLSEDAPNVSRAMIGTITRAAMYIANRLPPEPAPRGISVGETPPRDLGPRAQVKVERAVRSLDADALLDDIASGRLDRQQIEAVKIINPELYGAIQGEIQKYMIENRPDVSRQQQVALSIITGQPLGAMMQPNTIRGFQEAHTTGAPSDPTQAGMTQPKPIGDGGGRTASRKAATMASGTDRLEGPNAM